MALGFCCLPAPRTKVTAEVTALPAHWRDVVAPPTPTTGRAALGRQGPWGRRCSRGIHGVCGGAKCLLENSSCATSARGPVPGHPVLVCTLGEGRSVPLVRSEAPQRGETAGLTWAAVGCTASRQLWGQRAQPEPGGRAQDTCGPWPVLVLVTCRKQVARGFVASFVRK